MNAMRIYQRSNEFSTSVNETEGIEFYCVGEGVFSKMGLPLWSNFLGEDGFATKILAK